MPTDVLAFFSAGKPSLGVPSLSESFRFHNGKPCSSARVPDIGSGSASRNLASETAPAPNTPATRRLAPTSRALREELLFRRRTSVSISMPAFKARCPTRRRALDDMRLTTPIFVPKASTWPANFPLAPSSGPCTMLLPRHGDLPLRWQPRPAHALPQRLF